MLRMLANHKKVLCFPELGGKYLVTHGMAWRPVGQKSTVP